jgi:hypothetical protein
LLTRAARLYLLRRVGSSFHPAGKDYPSIHVSSDNNEYEQMLDFYQQAKTKEEHALMRLDASLTVQTVSMESYSRYVGDRGVEVR